MRVEIRWMAPRKYYEPQGWEWCVEQRVGTLDWVCDNYGNYLNDSKSIIEMTLNITGYYPFSFTLEHEGDILVSGGLIIKL